MPTAHATSTIAGALARTLIGLSVVEACSVGQGVFGASENGFKSSGVLIDANVQSGEDPSLICAATLRTIASGGVTRCAACGAMYGHDAAAVTCVVCDSPM